MSHKAKVLFVAAHGPAFSGKDTVCKILYDFADRCYRAEARFAEPIYEMVRALVPDANPQMSKLDKERPRAELGGLSVRQALVSIGEGFRLHDKECWIKIWRHSLLTEVAEAVVNGCVKIVVLVPDLRKQDELMAFHGLPGELAVLLTQRLAQEDPGDGRIWPTIQAETVVFQIHGQNAPVNEQVNEATETRLPEHPEDLPILNDHARGKGELREQVWAALGCNTPGSRGELFIDLFKRDDRDR